jgi:L-lysine exporter family protein LysE/ArgO
MLSAFIHGLILAIGLIIPLGIQNIFIFNQGAMQPALKQAFPAVITASLCDTLLILLAVVGVSLIVLELPWLKMVIYIIGFWFLVYMGWVIWNASPTQGGEAEHRLSTWRQIRFTVTVSILNPHAIIDSVVVIGTNSLPYVGYDKVAFAFACVLTSWIWFFSLATVGHYVHRLDRSGRMLFVLNKLSACIIWAVALYIGWQLFTMVYA